jgi:hypothetical protein
MPIIVGAPRSGTTLLRFMLDSHPEVAIPPETGFLVLAPQFEGKGEASRGEFFRTITEYPPEAPLWVDSQIPAEDFREQLERIHPFTAREGFRAFYRLYASRFDKPRWGDKTPLYCLHLRSIAACLPEAHFIHIIRDGRDVALSLRQTWFSPGPEIETLAAYWRQFVATGCREGRHCRHYLEVRYEDLVLQPEGVLKRICRFLELKFDPGMLRYFERSPERLREHVTRYRRDGSILVSHEERLIQQRQTTLPPNPNRIAVWRSSMNDLELLQFEAMAGDLLEELGYPVRRLP